MPLSLAPAMPDDLTCETNKKHLEKKEPTEPCIAIKGKMWSRPELGALAATCVARTGVGRQVYYAFTHAVLNVAFNLTWPDSGQKLTEDSRPRTPPLRGPPDHALLAGPLRRRSSSPSPSSRRSSPSRSVARAAPCSPYTWRR
ncbi:MAG: hypothetical protein V9F03_05290 [Microthrixaceae bacterium]